jgi:3-oxoacyl-[acyl-carrier protein] reductase
MMLSGKLALVTGASRGIGQAIARTLAAHGASVVGTATTAAGADSITQALAASGNGSIGKVLDVRDGVQIDALLGELEKTFSRSIDILVNNAGITQDNIAVRMKETEWDAVMDTNLKSVFRLSKAVLRGMMKARNGRIINITSVVGSSGNAGQMNYAAAKAGVEGMSRSLAREIGSRNVTVNCIAPGFIDTDMTRSLGDTVQAALLAQIPLGRLGTPDDVAAAVAFLASPQAGYITGATLHVNGGMYMN